MNRRRFWGLTKSEWQHIGVGLLFASPFIVGFLALTLYPMIMSFYYSFNHYTGVEAPRWIGLNNYSYMLSQDDQMHQALANTVYLVVFDVPAQLLVSFVMALLLNVKIRGMTVYRAIYILPAFMPAVPVAVLWTWIFNSSYGVVNVALGAVGLPQPLWLADPNFSKPTLIFLDLWTVGTTAIIYLAALQGVPDHLYEAASLDGAGPVRRVWHVTLPLVSAATFFNLITTMVGTFQIFTEAYVLSGAGNGGGNGGVGNPQGSLLFYVLYLWENAFSYLRMGYASAMAWLLFLIVMACTAVMLAGSRRWVYYEGDAA